MLDMFASSTGTQGVSKAAVWRAWLRVSVYRRLPASLGVSKPAVWWAWLPRVATPGFRSRI